MHINFKISTPRARYTSRRRIMPDRRGCRRRHEAAGFRHHRRAEGRHELADGHAPGSAAACSCPRRSCTSSIATMSDGPDWYAAQFAGARTDQLIGEKSASYLADARVPARLRAVLPEARLIVQLRNPIERAYSDYCMLLRRGEVERQHGALSRQRPDAVAALPRRRPLCPSSRGLSRAVSARSA